MKRAILPVAGALILGSATIDAARDVGRLLFDRGHHAAGLPVEAHRAVFVANVLDDPQLRFNPIQMIFFVMQDFFEHFSGSVIVSGVA